MKVMNIPLALASKSPRRQQLLREAGFRFRVILPEVNEIFPQGMPPHEIPAYLSELKARAARPLAQAGEIILAADSVVVLDNQLFGKPKDEQDARSILATLAGKTHQVITGVTLIANEKIISFSDTTEVSMAPLSEAEINYYIRHFHPFDKAGSYGIQEWIGHCKVTHINGSYLNVMGLPVHRVYEELQKIN